MQSFNLPPAPAVPLLDGVPHPVSVSWYTFFVGMFQSVGSGLASLTLFQLIALFTAQRLSLTVPSWLTVTGSPIGGSSGINGTLAVSGTSEPANTVLAAPNAAAGALTPRLLVGADLPNPAAGTLGGVKSLAAVAHNFMTSITTAGQPVAAAIVGGDLPTPTSTTLGGVKSLAAVTHNFLTSIDTTGLPAAAQPAVADLSDSTAPTSFSPTDQSGAALTFSAVSVQYLKIGNMIWMYGTLTYPITVDATAAKISLPVAVPNASYANVPGSLLVIGVASGEIVSVQNSSTAQFDSGAGALYTNANLSAQQLRFSLLYPAA